jgi:Tol biopolymer transport system component
MLNSGTKLGPYEIVGAVGAGGMGEVYRARDARLDREVAIKVLPPTFAHDADRLRRFEIEARTVASLNHPNILQLHDIGEYEGSPYLVCELLEGETLRERMDGGALGHRKAVEYASQVAQGLAAAHDKGIVHRDLKPDNVFITNDGRVKILDFGLAKLARAQSAAAAGDQAIDKETSLGQTRTTPGLVLGTAGYMSPEQVRGKEVDARTDIFSFGALLYEMLSGQRAFRGESSVETMNAILKEDPQELAASGLHVSPSLERMVRRCLEKNPEERFQSARDLAFALEALSDTTITGSRVALPAIRKWRWVWPVVTVLVAVAGVFVGSIVMHRAGGSLPTGGKQLTFREGYIRTARFSPDAKSIVYAAMWDGAPMQLYAGRVDSVQSQVIEPAKADLLSVSRTGEMAIALDRRFMEPWVPTGVLARVPLMGGAPRGILDGVTDADWSPDGTSLAVCRRVGSRFQLEYPVGKVLYETAGYVSHLRFSPDGKYIAFMDHPLYGDDRGTVAIIDLSGKKKTLTPEYQTEQGLAWSPNGKEIWYTSNIGLFAVSLSGQARSIFASLHPITLQDISAEGSVLLSGHDPEGEVVAGTVGGKESKNLTTYRWATAGGFSEDGTLAVINEFNAGSGDDYEIFARRADGSPATDLGPGLVTGISPDGKWVLAFLPTKPDRLLVIPAGVGETKTLPSIGMTYQDALWFPDGRSALVVASKPGGDVRTYIQGIDGAAALRPVTPEGTVGAMVSADGKSFIARDREGHWWIYDIAGGNPREARWMSSDEAPVAWLNDGSVLVWLHGEMPANIYKVDVASGKRQLWRTFTPSQRAGVLTFRRIFVTRDAKHYLYETRRVTSELFVLQGLK